MLDSKTGSQLSSFSNLPEELLNYLQFSLERSEKILQDNLKTSEPFLTEIVGHLARAGGKRFRPLFVLVAGKIILGSKESKSKDDLIKIASIVEMIHLATLYHDDVMDEALIRRSVPSVNSKWSNTQAILAGDYLFAQVSKLSAEFDQEILVEISNVVSELVTGQLREANSSMNGSPITPDIYLQVIKEKTASLIGTSGFLAGSVCGGDNKIKSLLKELGLSIGMTFQIVDDVIDLTSSSSGKTPGTDLKEGVFTLPVLYAMDEQSEVGIHLKEALKGPVEEKDIEETIALIKQTEGIEKAKRKAREYSDKSLEILSELNQNDSTELMRQIVNQGIDRIN